MSNVKVTLVGAPFSTFSRTIRMALRHLKIEFEFTEAYPHSKLAYKHNPFGRIPSLLYEEKSVFETSAIRDFIETKFDASLTPKDLDTRIKMDQIISVLCDYIFHHVIFGVAKPREYYEGQNKTNEEIQKILTKPLKKAGQIIKSFDSIIVKEGPFLCGSQLTWADYYVYPALADIYSIPESEYFKEQGPNLFKWFEQFKNREEVEFTYPGTIADLRKQKKSNL